MDTLIAAALVLMALSVSIFVLALSYAIVSDVRRRNRGGA
jgi:hypothetical protein